MVTVQIKSEISIDINQLLEGVAQLDTPDLEQFLTRVSLMLAQRQEPTFPSSETDLLEKINQGLPDEIQNRYNELNAKLHDETITPEEYQALLKLIDVAEQADAKRLQHLIALAQLRQVSLTALMKQLDIHQPPVHV